MRLNPGDDRRRAAERAVAAGGGPAEQARLLVERARAGEISPLHLEVAAALGHPVARLVLGDAAPELLDLDYDTKLHAAAAMAGPCAAIAWGADALERVLPAVDGNIAVGNVVAAARSLAQTGFIKRRSAERIRGRAYDASEAAPASSVEKSVTDGADALAVGLTWFDPKSDRNPAMMATQAHGAVSGLCAAAYRAAEPLGTNGPARETPARRQAYNDEKLWAMRRLAEYLLGERVVGCKAPGDGGAEWVEIREKEASERRRIRQLIEDTLRERSEREKKSNGRDETLRDVERSIIAGPLTVADAERAVALFKRSGATKESLAGIVEAVTSRVTPSPKPTLQDVEAGDLVLILGLDSEFNLALDSGASSWLRWYIENAGRELERRKPPLPVVIRAWEDPSEQHRRRKPGEGERFWVRLYGSAPFDPVLVEAALHAAGARIAPRSREWGELHRSETAVFSGLTPREATDALRVTQISVAGIEPKTWGGDALSERRRSPSLILLFPTEACAPPDDCDSVMWQDQHGWTLSGLDCSNYAGVVSRTRAATPEEYAPAVAAYEAEFGRRLRVYARSRHEFDRARRAEARRHGY